MNTLLLTLALLAWTPPPQLEQEVLRQGQEIQQLQSAIEAQQRETRELRAALEQQQPPCVAELEALNPNTVFDASESDILRLEVLGTVSRPASRCLPASVWITGTYIDTDGQLICTGTVRDVASQEALTGSIGLEVRPFGLVNFVRWANQPQRTASGALRLPCGVACRPRCGTPAPCVAVSG